MTVWSVKAPAMHIGGERDERRPEDIYSARRGRTALHEAGHVLVAIEEGQTFDEVVLKKTADAHGVTRGISYRDGDDEIIRILLAGIVTVRLSRKRWYWQLLESAHDDVGHIADFFRGSENAQWGVDWNLKATVAMITEQWAVVEAIARGLLERRRLSHQEAVAIAEKKHKRRRPPGSIDEGGWMPLIDRIHWRIKYPRGMVDALQALSEGKLD